METAKAGSEESKKVVRRETNTKKEDEAVEVLNQADTGSLEKIRIERVSIDVWFPGGC